MTSRTTHRLIADPDGRLAGFTPGARRPQTWNTFVPIRSAGWMRVIEKAG
jgi:hypothetical protein